MVFPPFVVGEVPIRACSPEGGALDNVSLRLFPNLKRTHEYENLPLRKGGSLLISLLLSNFIEKKYFHGERENI
jgi:hypothetical protein